MRRVVLLASLLFIAGFVKADGPQDNRVDNVRPVPPPGVAVPTETYAELKKGVDELAREIEDLRKSLAKKPALLEFLPDVQIYYNSVHYALKYNEFHFDKEFDVARKRPKQPSEVMRHHVDKVIRAWRRFGRRPKDDILRPRKRAGREAENGREEQLHDAGGEIKTRLSAPKFRKTSPRPGQALEARFSFSAATPAFS